MKPYSVIKSNNFLNILCLIVFTFFACQEEIVEVTTPNDQDTITANSNLARLIQNTTTLDGSIDNIIDSANCITINLPVTVIANGVEITINTEADYEVVEAIFDEFNSDTDVIEIVFPIVIILNDYSTVEITNQSELETFIAECLGENEEDDDIECIDFQYPIVFSIYNSNFQVIETANIQNDEELYNFIDNLQGGVLTSLNFPVTMILSDESTIEVNSNAELQEVIEVAEDDCDEDDDYDWNDDDYDTCSSSDIELAIDCVWNISSYNETDTFADFNIDFELNNAFVVFVDGDLEYSGEWVLIENTDGTYNVTFTTNFGDLNGTWEFASCNDGEFELVQAGNTMVLTKDCDLELENPFTCQEFVDLESCDYDGDGLANFNIYEAFGDSICTGANSTAVGFHLTLTGAETQTENIPNATSFSSNTQTVYIRIDVIGSQNAYRIFPIDLIAQDCTTSCTEQNVNDYLVNCKWNIVAVDGSDYLIGYDLEFNVDGSLLITELTNNNTYSGNWLVFTDATSGRIMLGFSNINTNDLQDVFGNWGLDECDTDRLQFEKYDGTIMVLEQDCS